MSDGASASALRALVDVTMRFDEIVAWLRSETGVVAVRRSCWMNAERTIGDGIVRVGAGDGYRIEWFAEADFEDGEGLSFELDISFHNGEWVCEASARAHSADDERMILDLPTRYATDGADMETELLGRTAMLYDRREQAVRLRKAETGVNRRGLVRCAIRNRCPNSDRVGGRSRSCRIVHGLRFRRAHTGRDRMTIEKPIGRMAVDLEGRARFEKFLQAAIDARRVEFETRRVGRNGHVSFTSGPVRPATHDDLRLVNRTLTDRGL